MAKKREIENVITHLERGADIYFRIGGRPPLAVEEELAFQQSRVELLDWALAEERTSADILARLNAYKDSLPPDAENLKYGAVSGLPQELIETIAKIELLEMVAGVHPHIPADAEGGEGDGL